MQLYWKSNFEKVVEQWIIYFNLSKLLKKCYFFQKLMSVFDSMNYENIQKKCRQDIDEKLMTVTSFAKF